MQRITLEIAEPSDLELLLLLARRMGIKILPPSPTDLDITTIQQHKAVVEAGGEGSPSISNPIEWQKSIREDRDLPFRD